MKFEEFFAIMSFVQNCVTDYENNLKISHQEAEDKVIKILLLCEENNESLGDDFYSNEASFMTRDLIPECYDETAAVERVKNIVDYIYKENQLNNYGEVLELLDFYFSFKDKQYKNLDEIISNIKENNLEKVFPSLFQKVIVKLDRIEREADNLMIHPKFYLAICKSLRLEQ